MRFKMRYYQQDAYDSFFRYTAKNHKKNPLMVLPTGSGKSLLQAEIVLKILSYPKTRILMLTHQKELIRQNFEEFDGLLEDGLSNLVGIYSAGLKRRDTEHRVIFAGIQSVHKKAWELGWFDLVLIDECHLLPPDGNGMYRTFLEEQKKINPKIVIAGLSATPYRMKSGLLTEGDGAIFDNICHETTVSELINKDDYRNKAGEQYLCNLISKNGVNKADLSGVAIRAGEYRAEEMQGAFNKSDLVNKAVLEIVNYCEQRKKVLIFAAGIDHAEQVKNVLEALGQSAGVVHSKRSGAENDKQIADFKSGKVKFLINMGILTTGFNEKAIDCVVLLRATCSPGLYYQMVGRGLRLHPDKKDCLVLDFGKNVERFGAIDKMEIVKNKKTGKSEPGEMPQKECPVCHSLIFPSIMVCPDCQYIFPANDKHEETASEENILSEWKEPEELEVSRVQYFKHEKKGKPASLRIVYKINMVEEFSNYICLEHGGFATVQAHKFMKQITEERVETVDRALEICDSFRKPIKITVDTNEKFPKIVGYQYDSEFKSFAEFKKNGVDEKLGNLIW